MDDQMDILGTLSSPLKNKSISFLKTAGKTNMKFDNNNAIINLVNSPSSRQTRSAEFNKENEFVNNSQKKKFSAEPVDTILSFEDDEECDVLDCDDELIDLESLIPSGKKLWLIDTQSTLDDSFKLENWLNQSVSDEESESSSSCGGIGGGGSGTIVVGSNNAGGGLRGRIWSAGRSGLCKPSPISNNNNNRNINTNNNIGDTNSSRSPSLLSRPSLQTKELSNNPVAASQLETLRRKSKMSLNNSFNVADSPCNMTNLSIPPTPTATNSYSTNNLNATIAVSSPSPKVKPPSMLSFGESKSRFGLRVPSRSSESETGENRHDASLDEPSALNLTFDVADDTIASGIACSSPFLNKSFDDVLSVAAAPAGICAAMQKSWSKSQESCFFSPKQISVVGGDLGLGSMGSGSIRGSTNKITNVEDVQNIARLQADYLRQTIRAGGFSNKRLSQSTDRLRHMTSNNNLADPQEQFMKMPTASDSDDNLVSKSKAPPLSLTQNLSDSSATMSHPQSLPNIIPRTKMVYQAPKKLHQLNTSPGGGSQPIVAKELPKSSLKMTASCLPNGGLVRPQPTSSTKLRNPSLNRGQQNPSIPTKQAAISMSPSHAVVPTGLKVAGANSKLPATKQFSRLQPPQSGGKFRGEKLSDSDRSSEGDGHHDANSSGKSSGSGRVLQLSSEVGKAEVKASTSVTTSSTSQTSLPVPKGIPRLSSIPRSRLKPPTKSLAGSNI